ncbi:uncharacterized protein [Mobula birostris]|uniref:uncharacterized protein isoform X2 n=1 Tax=Mobula birostris TaxID=1983395 RepID=UPI003B28A732
MIRLPFFWRQHDGQHSPTHHGIGEAVCHDEATTNWRHLAKQAEVVHVVESGWAAERMKATESSLDTMNKESLTGTSSLYSSTFVRVISVNVEMQYTRDVAVKCNPRITPHKNDWIGIFKVGRSTAGDYRTFVWAPLPKEVGQVERQQQVTFEVLMKHLGPKRQLTGSS